MILDGACRRRKLRHTSSDACHFVDRHGPCRLDSDGATVEVQGGEIIADHMIKAARLAAWFFCQPSGGSAAQGWVHSAELRA
eukprot:7977595-Pyramimonas_sp.AAC.1